MSCPDIDALIDLFQGYLIDPEMERHVRDCPECREYWRIFYYLPLAWETEDDVPESWVQGVMDRLEAEGLLEGADERAKEHVGQAQPASLGDKLVAGALVAAASLAALTVAGTVGEGQPAMLFGYSVLAAVIGWLTLPGSQVPGQGP